MSQIVSQNPMDITIEIVDEYIGRIPEKTLRLARDYIYEDRCIRKMRMPGRLIAELRGYHDSYIPHFELSKDLWQGGCTCTRPAPCAHIGALLLSFPGKLFLRVTPSAANIAASGSTSTI